MYGSPLWFSGHRQMALWFLTWQKALIPQFSKGQGSWHSLWIHALLIGHSKSLLQPARKTFFEAHKRKNKNNLSDYEIIVRFRLANIHNAYVQHMRCMDLLHSQSYKCKLACGCWLCTLHWCHMWAIDKDFDRSHQCMQALWDNLGPWDIRVLKETSARCIRVMPYSCKNNKINCNFAKACFKAYNNTVCTVLYICTKKVLI